jgi:hypothetical protein
MILTPSSCQKALPFGRGADGLVFGGFQGGFGGVPEGDEFLHSHIGDIPGFQYVSAKKPPVAGHC